MRILNILALANVILDADNGANGGGGSTAQTEGETKTRRTSVSDETIIEAYLTAANDKNADGEVVGTLNDVATACDMEMGSLNGRLTALRKILPEGSLPKLARRPSTGSTRKKDPKDVLALFNKINSQLADGSES